jgi:CheY-like chemotaxis protein
MTMPGLTGLDLAREIRAVRPAIPIILCTGYSTDLTNEKLAAAGIFGLIEKPFQPASLAAMVRQALDLGGKGAVLT